MKKEDKLSFWEPNGQSILANSFVRWVNFFLLLFFVWINLIFVFAYIENNLSIHQYAFFVPGLVIVGLLMSLRVANKRISKTSFYLWDYTERKKRDRYIFNSIFICSLMGIMLALSVFLNTYIIWHSIENEVDYFFGWNHSFAIFINSISPLLLALNFFKYVELYYFLFEGDLTMAYKIQKRPEQWMDDGKEIKHEEDYIDIMRRDFGNYF